MRRSLMIIIWFLVLIPDAKSAGEWSLGIWSGSFGKDGRERQLELSLVVPGPSGSFVGSGHFGVADGRSLPLTVTGWHGESGERLVFSSRNGAVFDLTLAKDGHLSGSVTNRGAKRAVRFDRIKETPERVAIQRPDVLPKELSGEDFGREQWQALEVAPIRFLSMRFRHRTGYYLTWRVLSTNGREAVFYWDLEGDPRRGFGHKRSVGDLEIINISQVERRPLVEVNKLVDIELRRGSHGSGIARPLEYALKFSGRAAHWERYEFKTEEAVYHPVRVNGEMLRLPSLRGRYSAWANGKRTSGTLFYIPALGARIDFEWEGGEATDYSFVVLDEVMNKLRQLSRQ